jgi:hypothetical protein
MPDEVEPCVQKSRNDPPNPLKTNAYTHLLI